MGLPSGNPDGYRSGSAINFASGLEGKLLVIHGSGMIMCITRGRNVSSTNWSN